MGAVIPRRSLGYIGQVVKQIMINAHNGHIRFICDRDRRRRPVDHRTGRAGRVNRLLRRVVLDVPWAGRPCEVEIEYAEVFLSPGRVRVEALPLVAPGARVTRRYARLIAGMARHMPISAVARHTCLSWDAVKAIECAHLAETLEAPRPELIEGVRYLGVDEVARAKGQTYFTLVYDLTPGDGYGRILWVGEGRDAATLGRFLEALNADCANGIEAVAMDMGLAYQAAVRQGLPQAAIVFDRFHVMQLFGKVIRDGRRAAFKEAKTLGDLAGQQVIRGSLYLLLSNRDTLRETDQQRLERLLEQNQALNTLYALKEQLQRLWQPGTVAAMAARLEDWCGLARAAKLPGLAKFANMLQAHRTGICAWADHAITTSRLEAGNVSIGLLRRRARGFRDTAYFKLKILQLNTPDRPSFLFSAQGAL